MRPAHFALVLFVLSFLLSSLSSAQSQSNIDPCPGCYYTYIAPRLTEEVKDPSTGAVTQSVEALLYASTTYYYASAQMIETKWRELTKPVGTGNTLFEAAAYQDVDGDGKPDTQAIMSPLPGKKLNFYMLTYVRDPATGIVTETKTPLTLCQNLPTDANGIAKCIVSDPAAPPPQPLPQFKCTPIQAEYAGEKDPASGTVYYPSTGSIDVCGEFTIPFGVLDVTQPGCLPIFILFGLLAGAMYAAGRNPTALFDISTPRMPRPKPYGMRRMSFGTGGAMQRLALNKQLRLSQTLQDRSIRRLARDLKNSGINAAEIDALLLRMRAIERPTNHEIAAALRIMATRGCGAEEALRRVKEIKRVADAQADKEGFKKADDVRRELLEERTKVVHGERRSRIVAMFP